MWRSPEDLIAIGFGRSRIVMMNEFRNNLLRCVWMRETGARVLPKAHAAGVRHLAMEALEPADVAEAANRTRQAPRVEGGYLAQPEMQRLIQTALDLGWTLHAYEADFGGLVRRNLSMAADEETMRKLKAKRACGIL